MPLLQQNWRFLCDNCLHREDEQFLAGAAAEGPCARCGGLGIHVVSREAEMPGRAMDSGWNNPNSSCALVRRVVWDVNGYYRLLGLPTDATRKAIMRRYMEMDGHSDARATYAAKVLLGSKRELYDSLPLGTMYADPWVIASAQSRAAQRFSHQAGTIGVGDEFDEDATLPTPSLEGQGVVIDDESSTLSDTLPGDVRWDRFANEPWRRYRWRSDSRDSNKIAEWRTAVGLALWRRGVVMDYGVGFMGFANDLVAVENVLGTPVAFLADHARVTTEAANLAALRLAGS